MRFLRTVSLLLAVFLLCGLSACQKPTEPQKHDKFYYALLNTDHLTYEDSLAIQMLLASYQDHEIVTIDVKDCSDAIAVYNKLKADYATRENTLDGIQIFGTSYMVPSFWLNDKVVCRRAIPPTMPLPATIFMQISATMPRFSKISAWRIILSLIAKLILRRNGAWRALPWVPASFRNTPTTIAATWAS